MQAIESLLQNCQMKLPLTRMVMRGVGELPPVAPPSSKLTAGQSNGVGH